MTFTLPALALAQFVISKSDRRAWLVGLGVLGVVIAATVLLSLLKRLVRASLTDFARRTETPIDDMFIAMVNKTSVFLVLFLVLWLTPSVVRVNSATLGFMRVAAVIALLLQLAVWANTIITLLVERFLRQRGTSHATAATAATALAFVARLLIGAILLLIGLNNLGVNVTAMVAGLGLGGLVVALALQNLLRDLLGALAIVMGRPFLVGDVIETADLIGTVEFVGMRSTQVRSVTGEEVTVPNNRLLESPLRNLTRRREHRVVISLALSYDTPVDTLAAIPEGIRAIVIAAGPTRFDNATLKNLGVTAVEFEIVYFVNTTEYPEVLRVRNAVNLAVLGMLRARGIELARPQSVSVSS